MATRRRQANAPELSPDERLQAPGADAGDVAHALARSVVQGVPLIGPAAAELFGLVIQPSYQQRLTGWMNEVAERLKELEQRIAGLKERLITNEAFVTTTFHAAQAAGRSHQPEKRAALRNAVLNAAVRDDIDEDTQLVFVNLIDEFTPWHLRVLKFSEDPASWYERHQLSRPNVIMGSRTAILDPALPRLAQQPELQTQVFRDLGARGLMGDGMSGTVSESGLWQPLITPWGRRFLKFIEEP